MLLLIHMQVELDLVCFAQEVQGGLLVQDNCIHHQRVAGLDLVWGNRMFEVVGMQEEWELWVVDTVVVDKLWMMGSLVMVMEGLGNLEWEL